MLKLKSWPQSPRSKSNVLFWLVALLIAGGLLVYSEYKEITSYKVNSWTDSPTADCGVVLTGSASRLREGLDLLVRKQIKKLVISGVHPSVDVNEAFPNLIYYPQLKSQDIVLEKRSQTTWGNAQQSLPFVEALGCGNLILVTSQLHMSRSYRTFKAVFPSGFQIIPLSSFSGQIGEQPLDLSLELIKSLFYSLWAY